MTPEQLEEIIERTASRTAEKLRDEFRGMLSALGFNMDPDAAHEEQQMIAFTRGLYQGKRLGIRTLITSGVAALFGWAVWFFTGKPHSP